jgi:hypothetical protein
MVLHLLLMAHALLMIQSLQNHLPAFTIYVIALLTFMNMLALAGAFDTWTKRLLRKKFRVSRPYLPARPIS